MEEEKIVKCIIELNRIFFPKRVSHIKSGEFGIFSADIIEAFDNCEAIYKQIKLKGVCCELNYNEKYNVSCKLSETNAQYGDTYEIVYINRLIDLKDKVKQHNFLMSILNETVVNRLFEKYDDVIQLLEDGDVKSLIQVKGIGTTSAMRLIDKYNECKDYSSIYTELGHLGFSSNLIKKLVEYYKSPDIVIDTVKSNPYNLVNVDGIGFKKADEIAEKLGIKGSNPNRVKGCMIYILSQGGESGKSYLHYSDLLNQLNDNIGFIEQDIINSVAQDLINKKEVHLTQNGEYIGLHKYFKLEQDICNELVRILNGKSKIQISNIDEVIDETEEEQGFKFTDEQRQAIVLFCKFNVIALTGGAGTGKSTTIRGMTNITKRYTTYGCALSGKASLRLKETTGIETSTIHRLLGYQNGHFSYDENNMLVLDCNAIDEGTMINGELFLSLLKAIPSGAKIVIAGDVQQLTSIGSCQIFSDMLNSQLIPSARLTKPHRQALKSGIIPTSMKVINQEDIFDSTFEGNKVLGELQDMELDIFKSDLKPSQRIVNHFLKQYEKFDNLMEVQIIVPMRLRGDLSAYNINLEIQNRINPISKDRKNLIISLDKERFYTIQIGDKVINTKNNYNATTLDGEKIDVFNGNMGIVKNIEDGYITIDFVGIGEVIFDGKSSKGLELAYATTTHKQQGSEFKCVICGIDSSAYILLNAEMLYTMITRAKEYCILVGKNQAVRTAISKREAKNKQTYLKMLLDSKLSA